MPASWASFPPEGPSRASPLLPPPSPPGFSPSTQHWIQGAAPGPWDRDEECPAYSVGTTARGGQRDGVCALPLQPAPSTGITEPQEWPLQSTAPKVPQRVNRHEPCAALPWQEHCSEPEMMHSRTLKSICYTQLCWARLQAAQCLV